MPVSLANAFFLKRGVIMPFIWKMLPVARDEYGITNDKTYIPGLEIFGRISYNVRVCDGGFHSKEYFKE